MPLALFIKDIVDIKFYIFFFIFLSNIDLGAAFLQLDVHHLTPALYLDGECSA